MNDLVDRREALVGLAGALALPRAAAARAAPRLTALSTLITGLDRPEGIAVAEDGRLFLTDHRATLTIRETDGRLTRLGASIAPCGVAIDGQGRAIVANMGLLTGVPGPLQRIDPVSGTVETIADRVEGRMLAASNNPVVASDGTIYCSHSAWGDVARIGKTRDDGFVYMVPAGGGAARVVAHGIRGANGCCLDRGERHLLVASTAAARILRYRRRADGSLEEGEPFGPVLGVTVPDQTIAEIRALPSAERATLGYCDGMAFDALGNLWITLPFANRIVALTPAGRILSMAHDPAGAVIDMPTNLAWGGRGNCDLFVVARGRNAILRGRSNVPGA
jgi:gluconolactonase